MSRDDQLTPQEILSRLDEYVVGQDKAKRAVSVALRNRWRRRQLPETVAQDVYPKNILLIGPTGCGKTEIARRLASLAHAPLVKVEATKYSEVGYHGRDVESMVRDLTEAAVALVRREHATRVGEQAARNAEARLHGALCALRGLLEPRPPRAPAPGEIWRPEPFTDYQESDEDGTEEQQQAAAARAEAREALRGELRAGDLDREVLEIEVLDQKTPTLNIMGPQGNDAMGIDAQALQEIWGRTPQKRTKIRKLTVAEARKILEEEEADKLLDMDAVYSEALERTENDGIVFIDEIDKVISSGGGAEGPDVSRGGVQRDLLSIVEGCTVYTRYGHVSTEHILFLAAGAFHFHKPSELIPELQGRFPVRVALQPLTQADFARILREPRTSLVRQYQALFRTEGLELEFADEAIERLAELAFRANETTQNIGARRLLTILEKCLETLSFGASERRGEKILIDRAYVDRELGETADDEDLIQYDV